MIERYTKMLNNEQYFYVTQLGTDLLFPTTSHCRGVEC